MKQLLLMVRYSCRQDMRERFLEEIEREGIIDCIRREKGFVRYDYYLSAADGNELLLVEQWASQEDQQAHLKTAHMKRLMTIKEKYVTDTSVKRFEL